MRSRRCLPVLACCLVVASGLVAACGGSSSGKAPDASKIATATLPATLPVPRILSAGAVQPGVGSTYTVKDGDTLAGIAARFGVSLADLADANPGIDASKLSIGQVVKLPTSSEPPAAATTTAGPASATAAPETATPGPATESPPTAPAATDTPPPPATTTTPVSVGQTYTVQAGDIPETIAAKFGITTDELMAANPGVNPTNLQIGQVLIIPPKRTG